MTGLFENISQINIEFMRLFFKQKKLSYILGKGPVVKVTTRSTYYGTNVVHFRDSLVWSNLLNPAIQFLNLKPEKSEQY